MICQNAGCTAPATVKTRFGNGYWRRGKTAFRQTFVHYCDEHFREIEQLFHLRDVKQLAQTG